MTRRARLAIALTALVALGLAAVAMRLVRDARSRVEEAAAGDPQVAVGEGWTGVRTRGDVALAPTGAGEGEFPSLRDVRAVLAREEGTWLGTTGGLVFVGRGGGAPRIHTARGGLLRNDVIALAGDDRVGYRTVGRPFRVVPGRSRDTILRFGNGVENVEERGRKRHTGV